MGLGTGVHGGMSPVGSSAHGGGFSGSYGIGRPGGLMPGRDYQMGRQALMAQQHSGIPFDMSMGLWPQEFYQLMAPGAFQAPAVAPPQAAAVAPPAMQPMGRMAPRGVASPAELAMLQRMLSQRFRR